MSRQFKTPRGSQRTSRDLRKHVQNHTYMINHVCIPLNTYVFWLKFFSFLFTVSLINFDLQSFNPSSVHVVSTAARSPDISSTWQPKRQAIQAVYAKGMMFLFLVHVYTTFTLRSHYIHTTFTLCSHYVHTTFTLRCSHFWHSHQAKTVWFLASWPSWPSWLLHCSDWACLFHIIFPVAPCCPYVKRRTCK